MHLQGTFHSNVWTCWRICKHKVAKQRLPRRHDADSRGAGAHGGSCWQSLHCLRQCIPDYCVTFHSIAPKRCMLGIMLKHRLRCIALQCAAGSEVSDKIV